MLNNSLNSQTNPRMCIKVWSKTNQTHPLGKPKSSYPVKDEERHRRGKGWIGEYGERQNMWIKREEEGSKNKCADCGCKLRKNRDRKKKKKRHGIKIWWPFPLPFSSAIVRILVSSCYLMPLKPQYFFNGQLNHVHLTIEIEEVKIIFFNDNFHERTR